MLFYLKLEGNFNRGLNAILAIGEESQSPKKIAKGFLPINQPLAENITNFWEEFGKLGHFRTITAKAIYSSVTDKLNKKIQNVKESAKSLNKHFNEWLNSRSFSKINKLLEESLERLPKEEDVHILIETKEKLLHQLPWHEWDLIQEYSNPNKREGEITVDFTIPTQNFSIIYENNHEKTKILVILGNDQNNSSNNDQNRINSCENENINVEEDRRLWEGLRKRVENGLEIHFLEKPLRKAIYDKLWNENWDFIYFGGHSFNGYLRINNSNQSYENNLNFKDLNNAFNKAVRNGLKVAFFNSCYGLEFIYKLEKKYPIPCTIVHRYFSYDAACQEFLTRFLQSFFSDQPKSINLALKEARERLQGIEDKYPHAAWLPVLFQQPSLLPLKLENLEGKSLSVLHRGWNKILNPPLSKLPNIIATLLIVSFASTGLSLGMRSLGWLQGLEFKTYDVMMSQRGLLIDEGIDERILIVAGEDEDIDQEIGFNSPSDETLAKVTQSIIPYKPKYIGLDFFRDQEVGKGHSQLMELYKKHDNLIGSCWVTRDSKVFPEVQNVGFIDIWQDPGADKIIRRISIFRDRKPLPTNKCQATTYLGADLAFRYLEDKFESQYVNNLIKTKLPKLTGNNGPFQNFGYWGFEILINYRISKTPFKVVTFKEVQEGIDPSLIKDKIIIIGMNLKNPPTTNNDLDRHNTPYSVGWSGESMVGVEIVAHVTSQIISTALDRRPLIRFLSPMQEWLWIWGFSLAGGIVFLASYSFLSKNKLIFISLTTGGNILIIYLACLIFLIQGIWLPVLPCILALLLNNLVILILEEV